jgi:hypothetical protein
MTNNQNIDFTVTNLTKSIMVTSASYFDEEKEIKNSEGLIIFSGVQKVYLFTVKNVSSKIIDTIIINSYHDGVLKSTSTQGYRRHNRNGIKPEESVEIQIKEMESKGIPAIEAIIFRDGSYEGNPIFAEAIIARSNAAYAKIAELMMLFKDRNLLSSDDNEIILNNVKEIRVLVDEDYEKNRMKIHHRDIYDFNEHLGKSHGIIFVDGCLKVLEQSPNRQGMQSFINRITESLKEVEAN